MMEGSPVPGPSCHPNRHAASCAVLRTGRLDRTCRTATSLKVFVLLTGRRREAVGSGVADDVIPARDLAVFSLGRLPDEAGALRVAEDLAARLHRFLRGTRMAFGEAGRALGEHSPNRLRYGAPTGTILIRWDGARQPTIWTVPRPAVDPRAARLELARRYLHVFGPTTPLAFAEWAGIGPKQGIAAFDGLRRSLTPVRTPVGESWILTSDEPRLRAAPGPAADRKSVV